MTSTEASHDPDPTDRSATTMLRLVDALLGDLHATDGAGTGGGGGVTLGTDLVASFGLDSLALVELQDRVEDTFAVRLPDDTVSTARTPADWLQAVGRARVGAGAPGSRATPARPARRRGAPAPPSTDVWPREAETLVAALDWHVAAHPDQVNVRLLPAAEGGPVEELTYRALADEAGAVAAGLVARGIDPGDRVALMLPTERAYFTTFMGVLLAGCVPVPVYPPSRPAALQEHLARQAGLLRDAGVTCLVTVHQAMAVARLLFGHVPTLRVVRTPQMLTEDAGRASLPPVAADDTALIQYTSGSTGDPKGVVLTHRQLLANIDAMCRAAQVGPSDVFVSWLPLYHDMGLIGAWHAPTVLGFPLEVMSPLTFLAHPARWLQAISAAGGTVSAAPNFAYQACVERIPDDQCVGLDLSSWRLAFNGSEPVSTAVIERFAARFGPFGFRPEAMCPAYGLAEVGVGVSFSPLGRGPRTDTVRRSTLMRSGRAEPAPPGDADAVTVVGCGMPLPGYDVRVEGPAGDELPDRREGSVSCRGPSATAGYFGDQRASRSLWRHGWLQTGDRGYTVDGELFLTGRTKDVIVRGGHNVHPEDVEAVAAAAAGVHAGEVAAFGLADPDLGTERLVVAVETARRDPEHVHALQDRVRAATLDALGLAPDTVVCVPSGALPRTASGKLRRTATGDAYRAGTLGRPPAPVPVQLARFAWTGLRPGARRAATAAGTWSFAAVAWAAVVAVAVPAWLAVSLPLPLETRWRCVRAAGRTLARVLGIDVRVEGGPPPPGQPAVVVANHASFVDGLVLLLTETRPAVFVSSTELRRQPVVGRFLERIGCTFVERADPHLGAASAERLAEAVRAGNHVVVFPEGSIDRAPGLRPFHLGAFAAAVAAGCPVVPVGIRGTRDVLRPGTFLPHRAPVQVAFGQPVAPTGDDFTAEVTLRDAARTAVADLIGVHPSGDGGRRWGP